MRPHQRPELFVPVTMPAEISTAISVASSAYEDLAASGWRLHFEESQRGLFEVILQDLEGNSVFTVSPAQVLQIAGGERTS